MIPPLPGFDTAEQKPSEVAVSLVEHQGEIPYSASFFRRTQIFWNGARFQGQAALDGTQAHADDSQQERTLGRCG